MKTFNINLENKHPVLTVALVVLLSIGIIAFMAGYIAYWWYVLQYVFNLVVAPIFSIAKINYLQAVGLGFVISLLKGIDSSNLTAIRDKVGAKVSSWVLLWPVAIHFLTYLFFA